MKYFFSFSFDWVMTVVFLVLTVIVLLPIGKPLVRFLAPHNKQRDKKEMTEEEQKQYARILAVFFGVLGLCELAAACVLPSFAYFSIPYFGAVMADLIWFIVSLRKMQ